MAKTSSWSKRPVEQYEHLDKERVYNPPVGLVTPQTDVESGKKVYQYDPHIDPTLQFDSKRRLIENIIDDGLAAESLEDAINALELLKKHQEPYLNWAGKTEHTSFGVDTVSLHVHERISPKKIMKAVGRNGLGDKTAEQLSLFETPQYNLPLREAIRFYKHKHNWSNRLIAGDSLLVMNSLLEKEGMAGQVQMIYFDPPYGIKYGSNFQPFINKRDVKDGKDEDLTSEPEMLKAFRDTWELGIHSYLTYLRDRLLLAREMLHESGSIFVQISEENIHITRCILDEIFWANNFISQISFRKKTMPLGSNTLEQMHDFILWYAKDKNLIKHRDLYKKYSIQGSQDWNWVELADGVRREMSKDEIKGSVQLPKGSRIYRLKHPSPIGENVKNKYPYEFEGKTYLPPANGWGIEKEKMDLLVRFHRVQPKGNLLNYILYHDDFPVTKVTNPWNDTVGPQRKQYVVQTDEIPIQRCMLMTTDPGDLILDPTCGSGSSACVAEKWGRRWITCDTSRVAITLAKQRLMTSIFDYYKLKHPEEGIGSGFIYKTVPHITLKSIANNEPPGEEVLYDQPLVDNSRTRVSGPFTVEAVPSPVVKSPGEVEADMEPDGSLPFSNEEESCEDDIDESVARTGETLRQSEWRDELFKSGIRAKGGRYIKFSRMEPLPGTRWLHADGETKDDSPKRVVISFGPEYAPLEQRQVDLALEEAQHLVPKPEMIVFASFRFDPEAAKDIDEAVWPGVTLLKAEMSADLFTDDLRKKRSCNDSFWLVGQPDIRIIPIRGKEQKGYYKVEVLGFDYYNPKTGNIDSGGTQQIAMWLLDTDYDGRSLYPSQVFFPMAGPKDGWYKLAKNLKAEIDEDRIEAYRGTVSLPFKPGRNRRVAVKIIDDRGIESLKVMGV